MRKKEQQVIYYKDELKDEFAGDHIAARKIDGSYRYIREGVLGEFLHFFWYRIIATPVAWLYLKLHFHHRIVNRRVINPVKSGFFLYGNHTHNLLDALIPTMVSSPKDAYVIVHPNNVSMPVLGRITPDLGALPLPDDKEAGKHFMQALEHCIKKNACVMIYPEAHIWPYYTDIRSFTDASFRYPVSYQLPVFSLTNTYQRRKWSHTPQIVTYVDGPFYSDQTLPAKQQKKQLRDQVYAAMKERAKQNTVCLIRYEKSEEK